MTEQQYMLEPKEIIVSQRFIGEYGQPIKWKIKAIKEKENQKIKRLKTEGIEKYWARFCAACVVMPDLNDKELLQSYGCNVAEDVLKEMLTMGEYFILLKAVREQNNFEERKENIKNDIKK